MFKDYFEVRDWLESFIPMVYGKGELGLARIKYFLNLLGNPHKKFKSIHVAGTSGKGSTAFYIAKLLKPSSVILGSETTPESALFVDSGPSQNDKKGLKVGLHISPHLVDIRERMQIFESQSEKSKSNLMPKGRFLRLFNEIGPVVEKIQKEKPELTPSYFEILVAASFKYFADEKVDWAVVEVGLGGRLDATNVLVPEVSVITNIGLDHTEILGKTIEKIAYEKAGIIKKGVPVVTAAGGRALEVIADVAKKQQAPLITIDTQNGLLSNKLLAIETVGLVLGKDKETEGIKDIEEIEKIGNLPGRFEEVEKGVILDGAHNPDKIKVLLDFLRVNSESREVSFEVSSRPFDKLRARTIKGVILVIGFKKGKQWKKMVDLLIKNLPIKQVIATKFYAVTDTGRFAAVEPEEIAEYVKSKSKETVFLRKSKVKSYENSQEAVFEAMNHSSSRHSGERSDSRISGSWTSQYDHKSDLVLVIGSLYLVGEVRTMWELPHCAEASRGEPEF